MKDAVFWDMTPCGSCTNRHLGGTYRLHLKGNETLDLLQHAARMYLTTDGEESLLHGNPQPCLSVTVELLLMSHCFVKYVVD
jgi:hypothetical protein